MMNKMKLLSSLLSLILCCSNATADILFLNDGSELRGKVTAIDGKKVTLRKEDKSTEYELGKVMKVQMLSEKRVKGEDLPAQIKDERLQRFLQNPPKASEFPGAGHIVLFHETKHILNNDGSAEHIVHEAKLLLKERGLSEANVVFSYLTPHEKGEILWARSIHKGKIHYLDDTSVKDAANYAKYPTYDRERSIKFSIPNALEGAIIDYAYKISCKKHSIEHPFGGEGIFKTSHPVLLDELKVTIPKDEKLHFKVLNTDRQFSVSEEDDGSKTYHFKEENITARRPESLMAPWWRDRPSVVYSVSPPWKDIANHYSEAIERARVIPKELARQTRALIKGCTNEQKLQRLFEFVLREIKLVGISATNFGPMPRAAAETFASRRGNYLDKAFFLYSLFRHHKISSHFALAMGKRSCTLLEEVPSLRNFFGGFIVLENGGMLFPYGDTTTREDIPEVAQGTSGFVVSDWDKKTYFIDIPLLSAEREELKSIKTVRLSGDDFFINEVFTSTGVTQRYYRSFKDLPKLALDKMAENMVARIDSKGSLRSYRFENFQTLEQPLSVHLDYSISDAVIKGGDKLRCFTIPGLYFSEDRNASKSRRENLLFYSRRNGLDVTFTCIFPPGFKLYHHPKGLDIDNAYISFKAMYVPVKNGLTFRFKFARKSCEVTPQEYGAYRNDLIKIRDYLGQYVVIER